MCTKLIGDVDAEYYCPVMKTVDSRSYYREYEHSDKDLKKPDPGTIACPHCHNKVKLLSFGGGWVGVCCKQLVYNQRNLPNATVE